MFIYLCCRRFFFSFSFPVISNNGNNVWHPPLVLSSAFLEMCSFRKYSYPYGGQRKFWVDGGTKEAVSEGVGVGSCGQCFMRLSRSNYSREVQNRISLQATKLCSNSEACFFDNGWERLLKTSTLGSSSYLSSWNFPFLYFHSRALLWPNLFFSSFWWVNIEIKKT